MAQQPRGGSARPHAPRQPRQAPTIDGPFATATNRPGGPSSGPTSLEELRTVTLAKGYERGILKGSKTGPKHWHDAALNEKVVLWRGDITTLQVDAILNAANRRLLGGGGIDGAIHRVAGPGLVGECRRFPVKAVRGTQATPYDVRIESGEVVITDGYNLPARKVLHCVGPDKRRPVRLNEGNLEASAGEMEQQLRSCYEGSLKLAVESGVKSIALCCISVGVFAYPIEPATHIALEATRKFLDSPDGSKLDTVAFVVFEQQAVDTYVSLLPLYFPPPQSSS